jgi:hypothetical protein
MAAIVASMPVAMEAVIGGRAQAAGFSKRRAPSGKRAS